ncbi:MAG: heme ABC transporter ATP-binding protein [Bacteroidota bacterium]
MLDVQQVGYRIGEKEILRDISFQGKNGRVLGIIGPNGAGKSTLLRLIAGDQPTTDGEIRWKGREIQQWKPQAFAQERAVLTQQTHLSQDFLVKDVVMMGRYPHFKRLPKPEDLQIVAASMQQTDVASFAEAAYQRLSGGEKQRVQLARALAQISGGQGPCLLLLDEPLNNLDIRYQHKIMKEAREIAAQGHMVAIVLHDINLASRYVDELLLLSQGALRAVGTPQVVLQPDILTDVFQIHTEVITSPETGSPIVVFGDPIIQSNHIPKRDGNDPIYTQRSLGGAQIRTA